MAAPTRSPHRPASYSSTAPRAASIGGCTYFNQGAEWGDSRENYNLIFTAAIFDCVISDCVFQGTGTGSAHHNLAAIESYDSERTIIEHCEFREVGAGIYIKGDSSEVPATNSAVIRYNLFTGGTGNSIELGASLSDVGSVAYQNLSYGTENGGGAIHFENSGGGYNHNVFYNNTIEGGVSLRAVDGDTSGGNGFYDNIVFDGTLGADSGARDLEVRYDYGVTLTNPYDYFTRADHNVFWRSDARAVRIGGHDGSLFDEREVGLSGWQSALAAAGVPADARETYSIESDPMFTDRGGHDFRLRNTGQAALTASSTGGPVGCYITGTEEIGLRASPSY